MPLVKNFGMNERDFARRNLAATTSNSQNHSGADPGVEDKATYGIRRLWKSLRFHSSGYALEDLEALCDPAKD